MIDIFVYTGLGILFLSLFLKAYLKTQQYHKMKLYQNMPLKMAEIKAEYHKKLMWIFGLQILAILIAGFGFFV